MSKTDPRLYVDDEGTGVILTLTNSGLDASAMRDLLYAALKIYCTKHRMVAIRETYKRVTGDAYLDVELVRQ